jgi:ribosomal protein S18 acetylase RimI-like enzyme
LIVTTGRKGVGKTLMAEIEKIAIEQDCYQVLFITENDRIDTIAFYESFP